MVGISKIVAESVNERANALPVYVPGAGGASGKCGTNQIIKFCRLRQIVRSSQPLLRIILP